MQRRHIRFVNLGDSADRSLPETFLAPLPQCWEQGYETAITFPSLRSDYS